MRSSFLLMLSFFTRLPVPYVAYDEQIYRKGVRYLPLIGFIMGMVLYALSFSYLLIGKQVMALLLSFAYLVLTGGLHLDGLADTCDGIFSGRSREKMLEIMKDSHIGTFGVLSLIIWFAFYIVMLPRISGIALLYLPITGKCAMLLSASCAPYARAEGFGKIFTSSAKEDRIVILTVAVLSFIAACFIAKPFFYIEAEGIIFYLDILVITAVALLSIFAAYPITKMIQKQIGGVTGDTFGFVCEATQMIFVAAIYTADMIWRMC